MRLPIKTKVEVKPVETKVEVKPELKIVDETTKPTIDRFGCVIPDKMYYGELKALTKQGKVYLFFTRQRLEVLSEVTKLIRGMIPREDLFTAEESKQLDNALLSSCNKWIVDLSSNLKSKKTWNEIKENITSSVYRQAEVIIDNLSSLDIPKVIPTIIKPKS